MKTINELLIETPLYENVLFFKNDEDFELLFNLRFFNSTIDYHCVECDKLSTFQGVNKYPVIGGIGIQSFSSNSQYKGHIISNYLLNQFYHVHTECTRNPNHKGLFIFKVENDILQKIGQYPSLASLSQNNLKKYRKVLSQEKFKEFNRGIGLTTHGIGIGSYVYLRRIFEDLIEDAHKVSLALSGWDEELFSKSRMAEKIELLKTHLPVFLVDNKLIYGLLSKGVHELSENECLEFFHILKVSIELILDEKIEELEKKEKQIEIQKALQSIKSKIDN